MCDHTIDEILSQPVVWDNVFDHLDNFKKCFQILLEKEKDEIFFIGCGTSYYLALSAAYIFTHITGMRALALPASDILFFHESLYKRKNRIGSVIISRSGTTSEAVWAAKKLQNEYNLSPCAISCRPESELVKVCENALLIPEADEKSVVMTRSFTAMLLTLQILASYKADDKYFRNELEQLPKLGKKIIDAYEQLPEKICKENDFNNFVYLGQGPYYGVACESMLKIKEMSVSNSEAYHSLEFRHGPMSLSNEHMLLTYFLSDKGYKEELRLLKDMKKLGTKSLVICEKVSDEISEYADYLIELNSGLCDFARLVLCVPFTQLLGYHKALSKGMNPDSPKNLTQVVSISEM